MSIGLETNLHTLDASCPPSPGKYILSGEMDDVSDALNRLLWVNLQACIGAEVLALPDDFRRREAYRESVCNILKSHEHRLHHFFEHATTLAGGQSSRSIGLESWLEQLRLLDMIGADLAEREAVSSGGWVSITSVGWQRMLC